MDLTYVDGTPAEVGSYHVRFGSAWSQQEAIVDAGSSEIPLQRRDVEHVRLQKGMQLATGGSQLEPGLLERVPEEELGSPPVNAVNETDPIERIADPPDAVLSGLNPEQRVSLNCGIKFLHICKAFRSISNETCGRPRILMIWVIFCAIWKIGYPTCYRFWPRHY